MIRSYRCLVLLCAMVALIFTMPPPAWCQSDFTARLSGVVLDPSAAAVPEAVVTIQNEATQVTAKTRADGSGRYSFTGLQPASYTLTVTAQGFSKVVTKGIVLRVSQQSNYDVTLPVSQMASTVEVSGDAALVATANAELGQEVTGRYVTEIPLMNRQIEKLAFLAPGVTEAQGYQTDQTNQNFVSNGQRNSSAELRLDGSVLSVPEAGEGAMFWAHYQPSVEIVSEFKVQTNGFSAQYGSNGGTVVNIVSKSGTNELHGSGYYFGQWAALNANDFFANRSGVAKPQYHRHQFGGTAGGPIVKNKLFYFFNYDQTIYNAPSTVITSVPTSLQRQGDFSQTFNPDGSLQAIYDPNSTTSAVNASGGADVRRSPFPNNRIPASSINAIGAKIMALYPSANQPGDARTGLNNFTKTYLLGQPAHQINFKTDYIINDRHRLSGRFSKGYLRRQSPEDFQGAIGQGDEKNDYINAVLDYHLTFSPTFLWNVRGSVDRHYQTRFPDNNISPTTVGFPKVLENANGSVTLPTISFDNYQSLGLSSYTQTLEAQTQPVIDSSFNKIAGSHNLQFGGETRILQSAFFQPAYPSGSFAFNRNQTMQYSLTPNSNQGNALASLLTGWANSGSLSITPSVAQTSRETSFFIQDDWKVSSRLTVNLGLRYEFSNPYTDRYNRLQIADFTAPTGVTVPGVGAINGIARFVTSDQRTAGTDWNNIAPRLGLAYRLLPHTVVRAGAGVYYGVNYATTYQNVGPSFRKSLAYNPTLDNGLTPYATLANPFPTGIVTPQLTQYGDLNGWGFSSSSNLSDTLRNAEIYQMAFSVQQELPGSQMVEIAYSGNRSTHLPLGGSRNRNFISASVREQYGTSGLAKLVANPFYSMFTGPNAMFNQPDSIYAQPKIAQVNLLRPYPQFPGSFEGFAEFVANSWYNSLQIKYEKRYAHGLNVIASYTLARQWDDSDYTSNSWLGNSGSIQDLNNLRGEYSVGATDARHRLVASGSYELPFGRGRRFGANVNRVTDTVLGGWQVNAYLTLQSPLPLNVKMRTNRIQDGSQRPNVTGDPRSQYSIRQVVDGRGANNYFNVSAFSDPGDQLPGNNPRFNSDLRGDSLRGLDFSLFKNLQLGERLHLQLRGEFFNATNTARFRDPNTSFGNSSFGVISAQANSPRQAQLGARLTF